MSVTNYTTMIDQDTKDVIKMTVICAVVTVIACLNATDFGANMNKTEDLTEEQLEQYYEDQYNEEMEREQDFNMMIER